VQYSYNVFAVNYRPGCLLFLAKS